MDLVIILAEVGLTIFLLAILLIDVFSRLFTKAANSKVKKSVNTLRQTVIRVLTIVCFVLCLLILAANCFLIYRGEHLQQYTLSLIDQIPSGFQVILAIGSAQSIGILILAAIVLRFLRRGLKVAVSSLKYQMSFLTTCIAVLDDL